MQVPKASASGSGSPWTTFHHDLARSGFTSDDAPTSPQVLWSYSSGGQVRASPVIANGTVFFGSENGYFYAANQSTGSLLWHAKLGRGLGSASPVVFGASVFVGDYPSVYRLNPATGAVIWNTTLGSLDASILAVNGRIYTSTFGNTGGVSSVGKVFSLSANDGSILWSYNVSISTELAYADGLIFTSSEDYGDASIYALNATDGLLVWKYKTLGVVSAGPSVFAGVLYAGGTVQTFAPNPLLALNATNGKVLWRSNVTAFGPPAIAYNRLYLEAGSALVALNETTGSISWAYRFNNFGPSPSFPAVANGMVFVGGGTEEGMPDATIYAVDAITGHLVWSLQVGTAANGSPAISDGIIYVGADDGKLYAIGQSFPLNLIDPILITIVTSFSFLVVVIILRRKRKRVMILSNS